MEKQREFKKEKRDAGKIKLSFADLMIPVVSGLIFILILFFILLPSIGNSSDVLLEIEDVQEEQKMREQNIGVVEGIDFSVLQRDLSNARKVLPTRLEVAQFAYYIDNLAEEKDLEFRELKAGDISISEEETSILDVKGIRAPMEYSGDYERILDFFNELQTVSPYVISFGHKVELNKSGDDEESVWNLEIDVTGHYVEEESEEVFQRIDFSRPIIPYDGDQDIVEEFAERIEILED